MMGMLEYIHETPAAVRRMVSRKSLLLLMPSRKSKEKRYMKSFCAVPVQVTTLLSRQRIPCRKYLGYV